MSSNQAKSTSGPARRWRLFTGHGVAGARIFRLASPSAREELVGRCPGCGALVRFSASASPVVRCGHCGTSLLARLDGLDVEQAVQRRLYSAKSGDMHRTLDAADD